MFLLFKAKTCTIDSFILHKRFSLRFREISVLSVQISTTKYWTVINTLNHHETCHQCVKAFNKKTWKLLWFGSQPNYLILFDLHFWFVRLELMSRKILEFERPHDQALQFYNIYYFQMKTERSWWHKVTGII